MDNQLLGNISENILGLFPIVKKKFFTYGPLDFPLHLSPNNFQVLLLLREVRSSTVSDLSKQLNVSRPNMTPLLDKLVEHGLADRQSCDSDRRVVNVAITEEGDAFCEQVFHTFSGKIQERLVFLPEEDLLHLSETLNELKQILLKIDNPTS
ncbi:MarR family transcriptional regulator [Paenibacillus kribbensis]|uniref:Transcriptional regulator n=1 Tax=Paenibacillus kribbensis TaxID=172713 RepID=A0A222WRU8_9BACL|nr:MULTISPECIES: MarR family transcriptional regulator [Paenibacillus]ASR48584.1 transcriptional regulator [Paenibacillus kribbensis]EHS58092.1 MarR family transcriptional regulator [Paenibacillus sp. Aloe-11]MEC0233235.1 MarR family transcriptional regulator [Paenibacillus kribbensis]